MSEPATLHNPNPCRMIAAGVGACLLSSLVMAGIALSLHGGLKIGLMVIVLFLIQLGIGAMIMRSIRQAKGQQAEAEALAATRLQEMAQIREQTKKAEAEAEKRTEEMHESSMDMALNLSGFFDSLLRVANGDYTAKATVDSKNDLMIKMAEIINTTIAKLRSNRDNIATLIGNIREVSMTIGQAFNQIQPMLEEMNRVNKVQNEKIVDTSTSITEMSTSVQEISQSSKTAEKMSTTAEAAATKGAVAVNDTVEGLRNIVGNIKTAGTMTARLGERSKEIEKIVNAITEISEQTNLLSLNAAIEAARAGEHGKGFAVVADEVRKLAERSATSAKEIGGIIEKIQKEMEATMSIIEKSSESAVAGMKHADILNSVFSEIQGSVANTNRSNEEIAHALEQQAKVCDDVVLAIDTITKGVKSAEAGFGGLRKQFEQMKAPVDNLDAQVNQIQL